MSPRRKTANPGTHEPGIFGTDDDQLVAKCSCGWEQTCTTAQSATEAIRDHIPAFRRSWDAPVRSETP